MTKLQSLNRFLDVGLKAVDSKLVVKLNEEDQRVEIVAVGPVSKAEVEVAFIQVDAEELVVGSYYHSPGNWGGRPEDYEPPSVDECEIERVKQPCNAARRVILWILAQQLDSAICDEALVQEYALQKAKE